MFDWYWEQANFRPIFIQFDSEGRRVVRFIDDVPLPEEWEIDKTVRPVVE